MSIEIFISDLDGTLLNEEHRISQRTAEAVRMAQSTGIHWLIATGRSWNTADPLLKKAGLKLDMVLLNGAEFRTSDGTLHMEESIDKADAEQIVKYLLEKGLDIEINTDKGDFSTNLNVCDTALEFPEFTAFWSENPKVLKIFAFLQEDSPRVNETKGLLRAWPGISVTSSAAWNVEITATRAQKGRMLERVIESYGISKDRAVVFGDGENDKSMFQIFMHTCAMGNSVPVIRKLAERVVACNTEDGVAREVERLLLDKSYSGSPLPRLSLRRD